MRGRSAAVAQHQRRAACPGRASARDPVSRNDRSCIEAEARRVEHHQRCCDEAMMATAARCVEKSGIMARWSVPPCCQYGAAGEKHAQRLLLRGELCSCCCFCCCCCCCCCAATTINLRAHTLTGARPSAMLRRGDNGDGSTELQVKSTSNKCYSEASSAPVVAAAALQQRLICALTGARPSVMLRRSDNGNGSTELKVRQRRRRCARTPDSMCDV